VPGNSDGFVTVKATSDNEELARFPVCTILFFARGNLESEEAACFAFTSVSVVGGGQRSFCTHCFRCTLPEAVTKVFGSFARAFKRTAGDEADGRQQALAEQEAFLFELSLEIKEKEETVGKAGAVYETVPRQKGMFKLRSNVEKKVIVTVQQISRNSCLLNVERCFGMLVSPGRNVRHADMQLLEQVSMATSSAGPTDQQQQGDQHANPAQGITHVLTGSWDPSETAFAVLNKETPPDIPFVSMTIAADLVIQHVAEPVSESVRWISIT